jgi:hypothetical protein
VFLFVGGESTLDYGWLAGGRWYQYVQEKVTKYSIKNLK